MRQRRNSTLCCAGGATPEGPGTGLGRDGTDAGRRPGHDRLTAVTREQERARAKRRYARRQQAAVAAAAEAKRMRQAAIVVGVLLAVIGGFIVIAKQAGHSSTAGSSSPSSSTASNPVASGCTQPPPIPGTEATLTAPSAAEVSAVSGKTVVATITTNCGDIVVDLDGRKAPTAVASFVQLAQLAYWKDAPCPRLTGASASIGVLQCGDPTGTTNGTPGYGFGIENAPSDDLYPRGVIAMARPGNDAKGNGGQFFLVYRDSTIPKDSAGGYTIFGHVTSGMDIVDRIAAGGVVGGGADGAPTFPISTLSVTTTTKD